MTDQTERDRIITALYDARRPGLGGMTEAQAVGFMADAVVAALTRAHQPAGQAPATDRAALRDRIAAALLARIKWATVSKNRPADALTSLLAATEYDLADAVLAVLPAPADRAAVLREVADRLERKASALTVGLHDLAIFVAKARLAEAEILDREATELRRMADEAQQARPRCPHCQLPHDLTPSMQLTCASIRASISDQPAVEAQQPTRRNIQCPDAFWRPRPHAPHDWQQGPDTQPVHCRGVDEAQQPKEAGERVVAYRSPGGTALYCSRHYDELGPLWPPVVSEDLPDGGTCTKCGADVLIPQQPEARS